MPTCREKTGTADASGANVTMAATLAIVSASFFIVSPLEKFTFWLEMNRFCKIADIPLPAMGGQFTDAFLYCQQRKSEYNGLSHLCNSPGGLIDLKLAPLLP
jgi:hypothetical protein